MNSPQRAYQKRMKAAGRCPHCGAEGGPCAKAKAREERHRQRRVKSGKEAARQRARKRRIRGAMFGVRACGACGAVGHNRRTCKSTVLA
jgi:hypothetical protein